MGRSFEYVRKTYGLGRMKLRGRRITVDGRWGTITAPGGGYIRVRFDGLKYAMNCHPRWRVDYNPT